MNGIDIKYQIIDETDMIVRTGEKTINLPNNKYFDDVVTMLIKKEGFMPICPIIKGLCDMTWNQILSKKLVMYKDDECKYDYIIPHYSLGDMQDLFGFFDKKLVIINTNGGYGGVVGDKEGITFIIHSNESDRHRYEPHVHCKYGKEEFRLRIDTLMVMKDDMVFKNRKKTRIAKEWVEENREELLNYYNNFAVKSKTIEYVANI